MKRLQGMGMYLMQKRSHNNYTSMAPFGRCILLASRRF
jgi:hypothetical protein